MAPLPFDDLASTTLQNYIPSMQDNVFGQFVFLNWIKSKCMDKPGHGRSRVAPLMIGKNTTVKNYKNYDTLDITPQTGMTAAEFFWAQNAVSIAIAGSEKRQNKGTEQAVNLISERTKQAEESLAEFLNKQFLSATATGGEGVNKDFNGIDGLVGSNAAGEAAVVGRIPIADAPTWVSPQKGTTASGLGPWKLSDLNDMFNSLGSGPHAPDFELTTQALYQKYEEMINPLQRFEDVETANLGFKFLTHKGVPVAFDAAVKTGSWYMLSSRHLKFTPVDGAWFSTQGFRSPPDKDASYALILTHGQLWTDARRYHGKLVGLT